MRHLSIFSILSILTGSVAVMGYDYGYSDSSYSYPGSSSSGYYDSGSSYSYPGSSGSSYYDSGSSYNDYGSNDYYNYDQGYGYDTPPGPKERPSGSSSYSSDYYGDDSWAEQPSGSSSYSSDYYGDDSWAKPEPGRDAGQDIPDNICSQYKSKREFLLKEHPDKVCPSSSDADCMKKASERFAIINNKCF